MQLPPKPKKKKKKKMKVKKPDTPLDEPQEESSESDIEDGD
jgi:hypothetical protein